MHQSETRSLKLLLIATLSLALTTAFQNCANDEIDRSTSSASKQAVVTQTPVIAMSQTGGDEIYTGATISFESDLQNPLFTYTWFFRPAVSGPIQTLDSTGFQLRIADLREFQSGDYWLEVRGDDGEVGRSNEISVNVRPSPFTSQPAHQRKNAAQSATFSANLATTQGLQLNWQVRKAGQANYSNIGGGFSRASGRTTNTLTISNIEGGDRGLYRLRLRSGSGSNVRYIYSQAAQLSVITDTLENKSVRPDAGFEVTYQIRTVKNQGGDLVGSRDSDQVWQHFDRREKTWRNLIRNDVQVKGKKLVVDKFNPRFRKYRVYVDTARGRVYSPANTITPTGGYEDPKSRLFATQFFLRLRKK
ncbi:MAG: hypothetical protein HRT45_11350, partial [Bdellovibrionales bacterium]|nr:hypothetical protein [Bdellovibrionales bacterium]